MVFPVFPLIALGTTIWGVQKIRDAKETFAKAERKVNRAQKKYDQAQRDYKSNQKSLKSKSCALGRLKLDVFNHEIAHTVKILKSIKQVNSELKGFETIISEKEFKQMSHSVEMSLELSQVGSAISTGMMAGLGTYGMVNLLGTASTGTAISTLSGAAASNATLAWFGGGSLAAGGVGMVGGMAVLGGVILGPAVLITGWKMSSNAAKSLTKAKKFAADVDIKVGQINLSIAAIKHIESRMDELTTAIHTLRKTFALVRVDQPIHSIQQIEKMLIVAKLLKELLDISVMTEKGQLNEAAKLAISSVKERGLRVLQ